MRQLRAQHLHPPISKISSLTNMFSSTDLKVQINKNNVFIVKKIIVIIPILYLPSVTPMHMNQCFFFVYVKDQMLNIYV
jgi:hypothetical protein